MTNRAAAEYAEYADTKTRRHSSRSAKQWKAQGQAVVPEMITIAKAAEALHRTPRYVRHLIAEGRLKAVRISERSHWLVFADLISALLGVKPEQQHSPEYHLKRDREILARRGLL